MKNTLRLFDASSQASETYLKYQVKMSMDFGLCLVSVSPKKRMQESGFGDSLEMDSGGGRALVGRWNKQTFEKLELF